MQQWEYFTDVVQQKAHKTMAGVFVLEALSDTKLRIYGEAGWELVSVIRLTTTNNIVEGTWALQYIFKRLKQVDDWLGARFTDDGQFEYGGWGQK